MKGLVGRTFPSGLLQVRLLRVPVTYVPKPFVGVSVRLPVVPGKVAVARGTASPRWQIAAVSSKKPVAGRQKKVL